jgi:hypothetical protein
MEHEVGVTNYVFPGNSSPEESEGEGEQGGCRPSAVLAVSRKLRRVLSFKDFGMLSITTWVRCAAHFRNLRAY